MPATDADAVLVEAFARTLGLETAAITDQLAYASIPEWDSIAHMALVARLEDAFNIILATEDILAMSSVAQARTILSRYDVVFDAPAS